jgi:hypothetical protein
MAEKKEAAYVLPDEPGAIQEYQSFTGFPGRFLPGQPVNVSSLGLDAETADRLVEELGLPLEKTTAVPEKTAQTENVAEVQEALTKGAELIRSIPERETWAPSEVGEALERSPSEFPGLSAEEAEMRKAAMDELRGPRPGAEVPVTSVEGEVVGGTPPSVGEVTEVMEAPAEEEKGK